MTHRKSPCDVCGSIKIRVKTKVWSYVLDGITKRDEIYSERCECGNLLYGSVKPIVG